MATRCSLCLQSRRYSWSPLWSGATPCPRPAPPAPRSSPGSRRRTWSAPRGPWCSPRVPGSCSCSCACWPRVSRASTRSTGGRLGRTYFYIWLFNILQTFIWCKSGLLIEQHETWNIEVCPLDKVKSVLITSIPDTLTWMKGLVIHIWHYIYYKLLNVATFCWWPLSPCQILHTVRRWTQAPAQELAEDAAEPAVTVQRLEPGLRRDTGQHLWSVFQGKSGICGITGSI